LTAPASNLSKGAYILASFGSKKPELILMASGSEVNLIYAAAQKLSEEGHNLRVVSFPSWELFQHQSAEYRESVLPEGVRTRLAVEAASAFGWERYVGLQGRTVSIDRYGASAPGQVNFEKFGFTVENVLARARELL
jgi:transketolase